MRNIGIIGAGSWGTALAKLLSVNGHGVTVYSAIASEIEMLKKNHEQTEKLPGVKLPDSMIFTTDMEEAVQVSRSLAKSGMVVLLSPACTSWDMYKSYKARGEHFCRIVSEISQ